MSGAGIRFQIFVALAISIVVGALVAGITGYHVFQRGLVSAFEARLQLLVDEVGRVLDAGMMAGLGIDHPQLLRRALASSSAAREGLFDAEIVAVLDDQGRIVASTSSAEVGERTPRAWLDVAGKEGDRVLELANLILVAKPIETLFSTTEGVVVARLPVAVLTPRAEALLFRFAIVGTAIVVALIVVAAAVVWLIPWPAVRRLETLQGAMTSLYQEVGDMPGAPPAGPLPRRLEALFPAFREQVLDLRARLHDEEAALNRLDEAA